MSLIFSIFPIALTIFCGYLLVKTNVIPKHDWKGIEVLSFRLLIPAILIKYIASSDLSVSQFAPMISAIIISSGFVGVGVLILRYYRSKQKLTDASLSTLFQTTTRWNAFITLVAAELFTGPEGLVLVAVAMAILIPLINIANIVVLAIYGTAEASLSSIVKHVLKNPLVQACSIGLALNLNDVTLSVPIDQTLDLIGRAAIAVGLLAVGAGIDPARLFKSSLNLWLGVSLRLLLVPLVFLLLAKVLNIGEFETLVGVLILAVPSASNGYIVAKQMGGDAELYADVLSWQVVLSMFLLPLYVFYLQ